MGLHTRFKSLVDYPYHLSFFFFRSLQRISTNYISIVMNSKKKIHLKDNGTKLYDSPDNNIRDYKMEIKQNIPRGASVYIKILDLNNKPYLLP
jgi:hypothetical protein